MAGAASQAGDADSSRAPGLTSGLQGSVNVHRGALLFVTVIVHQFFCILYCYERDFMSNLQKSKWFDLLDKFNDTSQYLDDIFTVDNPEFVEHIPDIYPRELQLNKANTSDKETFFLDLNIKVIGNNIHISVYNKRDDFRFSKVNFPVVEWRCS